LKTPSISGPEGLAINRVSEILAQFFVPVTADLKIQQSKERKIKDDNAKILARRKAKEIAAAAEATAESLDKETTVNYTTMLTVIKDESEKAAKKFSKSYLQSALRKNLRGVVGPQRRQSPPQTVEKNQRQTWARNNSQKN
jgi:hypothetical protein